MDPTNLRAPIAAEPMEAAADRVAVCRLAQLYAFGIDRRDEAMVRSVFTADATMRGALGAAPADEYVPQLVTAVAAYETTMHNITNQYVVLDGDTAEVWSYAVALHFGRRDGGADLALGVQYRDRATRTENGWLIAERHAVQLWSRPSVPGT